MNSAPNAPWLGLPVERAKLSTPALGVAEKWLSEYFANCWDGTGLVVEIGLFPGAATRAIAHGMAANPRRQGEAVLHAFHGFDDGLAGRELREAIGTMMLLHVGPLPDRPDEIDDCISLDCLTDQGELGALVIDGCKSWASTHYVMKFLLPRLRVGEPVIFQDFGSYPCFWFSPWPMRCGSSLFLERRRTRPLSSISRDA